MSSQLKSWLILLVIFGAGIATGCALSIALSAHLGHPPGNEEMRSRWMAALTHRLDLTADQQTKIQPIVAEASAHIASMHREEIQKGAEIFKDTDDKILALLTPEQQVSFRKMQADREKKFSGRLRGWGPGPPSPFGLPGDRRAGDRPPPPPDAPAPRP